VLADLQRSGGWLPRRIIEWLRYRAIDKSAFARGARLHDPPHRTEGREVRPARRHGHGDDRRRREGGGRRGILVGCTITGPEVADFLHAATIAVVGEVPLERLRHAVPPFPTRSEIWLSLLEQAGV
jgi:hypothetical protein